MTNDQYGNYQTPSSRPPEPPYRTDGSASAGQTQANQYGMMTGQVTESFNGTRESAQAGATSGSPQHSGYAQQPTPHAQQSSYEPQFEARHAVPQATAPAAAVKSGGAGKTFLFGFLGALLACAIALGCLAAFNGFNKGTLASTTIGTTDSSVINAVEDGQTLAEAVAAKALPSVVAVYNYQKAAASNYGMSYGASMNTAADTEGLQASGMGSGVVISDDGYIITNYHVIDNATKLTVKVGDDERDATFVGGDESSDVAVIKVDNTEGLTPADIGNSDDLVTGEWVMTVGAPLGLEQSVATGVVSATNRSTIMNDSDSTDLYSYYYGNSANNYTYYPNMIQTDAVINPGNSGGALVDADGKLIGINTMISSYSGDYAGVGFAIPVNYAIGIAEQVIAGKTPTHAMLGVSISSVNSSNAQRYGLSSTSGAYVSAISEGTGAAESDLQVGDIITQIDDSKISSTTDVTLEVREHNPGDTVTVTVNRNGETKEIPVVLSSDENLNSSKDSSDNKNNGQGQGQGQGQGRGYGDGGSNGYDMDQLEDILKMLGM